MTGHSEKSTEVGLGFQFDFTGTAAERNTLTSRLTETITGLGGICIATETRLPSWQRRLDDFPSWLLQDMPQEQREAAGQTFSFQGLRTGRSLLVMGEERLLGLPGVGSEAVSSIRSQLRAADMPVTLKDQTTVEDMAALCQDPSQIPLQVVMPGGFDTRQFSVGMRDRLISVVIDLVPDEERFSAWGVTPKIVQAADQLVDDFWGVKHDGKALPWLP